MNRIRSTTFEAIDDDPLLDLDQVRPVPVLRTPAPSKVREIASEAGFTARHAEVRGQVEEVVQATFDARSLRRTGRTSQLNIALKPQTKDRFWRFAQEQGYTVGEEALLALLEKSES